MRSRTLGLLLTYPLNTSAVRVSSGGGQSIPNATSTVISFPTVVVDELSEFNTSSNVFTAKNRGVYQVSAGVGSNATNWPGGNFWLTSIRKNGIETASHYCATGSSSTNEYMLGNAMVVLQLEKGDTLDVIVIHNFGSAVSTVGFAVYNYFTIKYLSV